MFDEILMHLVIDKTTHFLQKSVSSMLAQVERYQLGYTREFVRDPKGMVKTLISKARTSPEGFSVISLGYLGGNYAVITPQSQSQLTELLNQFDEENSGRKGHASFKFFAGNNFFIISDTGHDSLTLRKNLLQFLVPDRLAAPLVDVINYSVDLNKDVKIRRLTCGIVRAVMLKNILGVEQLPANTYDLMDAYRNDVKRWGAFPFPELFKFMPSLRRKQEIYKAFSRDIMEQEFQKLVEILHTHDKPSKVNLIAASIVSLFKAENPTISEEQLPAALKALSTARIRLYFENPVIQSLPMILKAADNLTDAIVLCLEQLVADSEKLAMLQEELDGSEVWDGASFKIEGLKSLPILNAFYKESVRFDSPTAVPRYTQAGYVSESMTIPPNTMVLFDLAALSKGEKYWDRPDEFDPTRFLKPEHEMKARAAGKGNQFPLIPFSVGQRSCPAFAATEVLFKVAIAKFVLNYDFHLVKKEEDDSILHISSRSQLESKINPTP